MFLSNLNIALHAIEIVPSVSIGEGLYIAHTVGTVIDARSIGRGVTIQSNVTVGLRKALEFPTIGNDVTLGVGCRILGLINVGDGATVGANSVVLEDVPPGVTVVGVPARIIRQADTKVDPTT